MWVLSPDITAALMYDRMLPTAAEMRMVPNPLVGNYVCQDGRSIVLMMLQAERFWPHFAETVGRTDPPRAFTRRRRRGRRAGSRSPTSWRST